MGFYSVVFFQMNSPYSYLLQMDVSLLAAYFPVISAALADWREDAFLLFAKSKNSIWSKYEYGEFFQRNTTEQNGLAFCQNSMD